jgi:general secretion pathway protein D
MVHRWMGRISKKIHVKGSQGSPQRSRAEDGSKTTLGCSMNRRAASRAASRLISRIAFFLVLALVGSSCARLHAESAKSYYKQGLTAEVREDYDAAFDNYQKAYTMAPKDLTFRTAYYRVRLSASSLHMMKGRKLFQTGDEQGALMELLRATEIDPTNEAAQQDISRIRAQHKEPLPANIDGIPGEASVATDLDTMAAPTRLQPMSNEPQTMHMIEDSKVVYQAVGKAAGINVLFDPDYTGKRIQVDLVNETLPDVLRIVATLSGTFWKPITGNTIFVAANSRTKRTELEEQAVQTFYLTNAWQQNDLNDVQTAIRNVMPNSHAYSVNSQNAIVMRGTPDELMLAQKIVNDLDKARPEVVVDIAVLEVSKNWERTLGIAWPQSASVTLQSPNASSTTCPAGSTTCTPSSTSTTNPTLYNLAHLNSNDFAVTVGTATANALLNDSNTKILQNPRIRSTDSQKATLKIGSRIPIATGSFQSGVGVAAAVTPLAETQFQYIEIGVNIDMTPTVHYNHDVTEPIIAQKKSEQTIRLHEGEASILGGILEQQDMQSWTGIPGLSSIPILKYLFGSKDHTITDDEIVFLLIPHIVRSSDLTPTNLHAIDTGSGQSIELRHVSADNFNPLPTPAVLPVRQTPQQNSATDTVPGATASAAAPAAIAQLRASADGNVPARTENATPPMAPPGGLAFSLVPSSGPVAAGSTFAVPIVITGAKDIASVPLQVQYDPTKLALVNVGDGDFLSRDGQAVALVHTDEAPGGLIKINTSRPPGTTGMSGAGVVCVLNFQAKVAGATTVAITRTGAMTSAQQPVQAQGAQTNIVVK